MTKITFTKAFAEIKKFANEFNTNRKNISADLKLIIDYSLNGTLEKTRKIQTYFKKKTGSTLAEAISEYL